jgi:hypothetical protein
VQYDRYRPADSFVAAQSDVLLYDAVDARVRSALRNRDLEAALARVTELTSRAEQLSAELQRQQTSIAQLEGRARRLSHRLRRRQTALVVAQEIHAEVARELALIHASRSWRWTQPLRSAFRLFGGR